MKTGTPHQVEKTTRHRLMRALTAAISLCALSACANNPAIRSAKAGDFQELRQILAKERQRPHQVRALAEETLKREVRLAKDREDRAFIRSLRACANPLSAALNERGQSRDGVAAEAQLLLLESGNFRGDPRRYAADSDGAFRAIAARAPDSSGDARRKFFSDPDERVRRAALLAALEAGDPEDVDALLEVSRVDPDPLCRSRAFQSLGRIGGDRVANALNDRFETGSEEVQLAIVDAWSSEALYEPRGKRRLTRLLTHKTGYPALHAAGILARDTDAETRNLGLVRLLRFAEEGTPEERRRALLLLPGHDPQSTKALVEATASEDKEVALIAWSRLQQSPKYRSRAQAQLGTWAESEEPLAYQARAALSASGDESILPLMKRQATHDDPVTRRLAGLALLRLRAFDDLAPLLADEEAEVRRGIACNVIAEPLRPRLDDKR